MYQNSPRFRFALYVLAGVATVASFFVRAADVDDGRWAQAVQDTADYLAGLGFVTAASNITPATVQRVRDWRARRRERARRV